MDPLSEATIYVVDDDEAMRDSIKWLLEGDGLRVATFDSAAAFLAGYRRGAQACLVLDVRMPGMSGVELQERLAQESIDLPIVFITGHGDVPMAVEAIRHGACDFLQKPFKDEQLLTVVRRALDEGARRARARARDTAADQRLAQLTGREREVLELIVAGKLNKTIADILGISTKTVEFHRAHIMEKTGSRSLAELVQVSLKRPA